MGIPFAQERSCYPQLALRVNVLGAGDIPVGPDWAGGRRDDATVEDRIWPIAAVEAIGTFVKIGVDSSLKELEGRLLAVLLEMPLQQQRCIDQPLAPVEGLRLRHQSLGQPAAAEGGQDYQVLDDQRRSGMIQAGTERLAEQADWFTVGQDQEHALSGGGEVLPGIFRW